MYSNLVVAYREMIVWTDSYIRSQGRHNPPLPLEGWMDQIVP